MDVQASGAALDAAIDTLPIDQQDPARHALAAVLANFDEVSPTDRKIQEAQAAKRLEKSSPPKSVAAPAKPVSHPAPPPPSALP